MKTICFERVFYLIQHICLNFLASICIFIKYLILIDIVKIFRLSTILASLTIVYYPVGKCTNTKLVRFWCTKYHLQFFFNKYIGEFNNKVS